MITTDIFGRNLIALNSNYHEIIVEIAPKGLDSKSTQAFLVDRKLTRQRTGYTIQEQIMIEEECYIPEAMVSSKANNIDYEDIYDNLDDYEYPYNHINVNFNKCKNTKYGYFCD